MWAELGKWAAVVPCNGTLAMDLPVTRARRQSRQSRRSRRSRRTRQSRQSQVGKSAEPPKSAKSTKLTKSAKSTKRRVAIFAALTMRRSRSRCRRLQCRRLLTTPWRRKVGKVDEVDKVSEVDKKSAPPAKSAKSPSASHLLAQVKLPLASLLATSQCARRRFGMRRLRRLYHSSPIACGCASRSRPLSRPPTSRGADSHIPGLLSGGASGRESGEPGEEDEGWQLLPLMG